MELRVAESRRGEFEPGRADCSIVAGPVVRVGVSGRPPRTLEAACAPDPFTSPPNTFECPAAGVGVGTGLQLNPTQTPAFSGSQSPKRDRNMDRQMDNQAFKCTLPERHGQRQGKDRRVSHGCDGLDPWLGGRTRKQRKSR